MVGGRAVLPSGHSPSLNMPTAKQLLGTKGDSILSSRYSCARCKRTGTLKRLPANFKCADVICDFCSYLAQVKAIACERSNAWPSRILGAARSVQRERMIAGIYFPLFIVLIPKKGPSAGFYLSADMQRPEMFVPRKPLSIGAVRAGWQGFVYDLRTLMDRVVRVL